VAMSYEPRMRGRRFRRTSAKKTSARERKEDRSSSISYQKAEQIDPSQLRVATLNAIDHLGSQRFALPPFSEHFQRWLNDIKSLLGDFESRLPEAIDEHYRESVQELLLDAQEELNKRIGIEKERAELAADLQQRLAQTEFTLSKMRHEYMSQVHDVRRKYEKSFDRLRKEINNLDKQRRTILRERTGILQKIFKRPENRLAESANNLQLKKNTLGDSKEDLRKELGKLRKEYENKRRQVVAEQGDLRQKLTESRGKGLDDAVELRRSICQKLRDAVAEAVDRLPKESDEPSAQE
jgi:hypothetical protein